MRTPDYTKQTDSGNVTDTDPGKPSKTESPVSECIRCGTCCKKGGPSFHLEDKMLIERGRILSKHLFTIREGQRAYDNVKGIFFNAPSDVIKIKGRKGVLTCVFLDEDESGCTIYDFRPLECRVLECRDTRAIEKVYARDRLARRDLISSVEGLWDLVEDHQKRCSYHRMERFIDALNTDKKDEALAGIRDIIDYDARIRELVVSKGGLDADMTDFLFGLPITETIRIYGLKVERKGDTILLISI